MLLIWLLLRSLVGYCCACGLLLWLWCIGYCCAIGDIHTGVKSGCKLVTLLSFLWYDKLWGPSQRVVTLLVSLLDTATSMIKIPRNILFSLTNKAVQYNFIFSAFVTNYVLSNVGIQLWCIRLTILIPTSSRGTKTSVDSKLTDDWFTKVWGKIAKGTTDPRVEFISQDLVHSSKILNILQFQNTD